MRKKISIIVPCFNEQEVITQTYETLLATELGDYDIEYIFVDDGSKDGTVDILRCFAAENEAVKLVLFARNFGHQCATSAGIAKATGDAAIIIDADLQDPPAVMLQMVHRWEEGYEIAYGKRIERKGESVFKKVTAWGYYKFLSMIGGSYIPKNTGDFRLIDKRVVDFLNALPEHNRFLRGLTAWAGFKSVPVEFVREERAAGQTKYSLKKMLRLAGDGVTAFSDKPLKVSMTTGVVVMLLSLLYLMLSIIFVAINSWPWIHLLFAGLFLLVGGLFLSLGIMGMYISRIYDEVKNRPMYIVRETVNI